MPKEHYYGLTAEGPNSDKGLEYVYLGEFEDFDEVETMADFQRESRLGCDFIWLSTRAELEALGASIEKHLTNPPDVLSFEP
jgi:hypothetical protein